MKLFQTLLTFGAVLVGSLAIGGMLADDKNARDAEKRFGVTVDRTVVAFNTGRPELPEDARRPNEVELIIKGNEGIVLRALAPRDETNVFFRGAIALVDRHHERAKEIVETGIQQVFATTFADKDVAVSEFADWYFAWGRSWEFLGYSFLGGGEEILSFSPDQMMSGATKSVEGHFMKHYLQRVLKPEIRNPKIENGVRDVLQQAYQEYRYLLEESDERLKEFVLKNARYIEQVDPSKVVQLQLDWDAQKFKAPVYHADEAVQSGMLGLAFVLGGAAAGPAIEAGLGTLVAAATGEVLVSTEFAAAGAVAGSEVPVLGTVIGALAGLTADYVVNFFTEGVQRDDFVRETKTGLELTIQDWDELIAKEMEESVAEWFGDTKQLMMTPELNAKLTAPEKQTN